MPRNFQWNTPETVRFSSGCNWSRSSGLCLREAQPRPRNVTGYCVFLWFIFRKNTLHSEFFPITKLVREFLLKREMHIMHNDMNNIMINNSQVSRSSDLNRERDAFNIRAWLQDRGGSRVWSSVGIHTSFRLTFIACKITETNYWQEHETLSDWRVYLYTDVNYLCGIL